MAVQSTIEQTIVFIEPNAQFDQNAIFANNLVQSLIDNSIGKKVVFGYQSYADHSTGVVVFSSLFYLQCHILPAFQATVQANIPNLQAAFPQYTIATWGSAEQFGN